ncbi:Asp-tRNA(Asn)/Glu-tRNA(Gln) amidotransferase GatCAB subunit A [Candidatus Woesearchaeota archaeon CG11_big_fil_rev_8_21_14_0_20_43_8]|nr:MAG: Asp-tRNA(Asn)/Glu-tRNA(Gln) amidotransferase GatCAB subunit A [Candidatus Woesearchaeota archaeon CG11_big_fil_rev_8_21_14_0_20_43_8]
MDLEKVHKMIEVCRKIDKKLHCFTTICEEEAISQAKDNPAGKLSGKFFSVKDCICVKGVESCAGSAILKGYRPPFDAFSVQRIKEEGGIIIGKTSQDEFGFGGFCVNTGVGFETPKNPIDDTRSCGGSSGGAACITKALPDELNHVALAESTGGSIACPAAFCGTIGLTPTYGLVSRWGLIDYGNSLDKIGPIAKNVPDAAQILSAIAKKDIRDSTSVGSDGDYASYLGKDIKGMKIGVISDNLGEGTDPAVAERIRKAVSYFDSTGAEYNEISLPSAVRYGLPAYYIIAMCESSTNLAKYCGMRYGANEKLDGNFNEYFTKVRSRFFGKEAKRRIILGTYARMAGYRDAYYIKAMKVRTKVIEEYKTALKKFDVLLSPSMPMVAPKIDEIKDLPPMRHYMADACTAPVNLAGLPHISIPCGNHNGMPVGMMLIGDHFCEGKLISLADKFERDHDGI